MHSIQRARRTARAHWLTWLSVGAASLAPATLSAQTDFFNTDGGRPLRVQDAHSVEWRALEVQFAPIRVEQHEGNRWRTSLEPELAFGVLPRTHLSVGFPLASVGRTSIINEPGGGGPIIEPAPGDITGLAGLHLSLFHQLNVETRIPAFAVRGEVLLPAGPLGPDKAYPSITGIMTRTLPQFGPVRVHANATATFGAAPETIRGVPIGNMAEEVPRWLAGVSVDRAFPLKYSLLAMELVARQGMIDGEPVAWSAGVGARRQFSPRVVLDAGVGRQFTGSEPHWSFTVGSAIALGLGRRLF